MPSEPEAPTAGDLVRWAEALSATARTGLAFTESLYERERFEEVVAIAAEIRSKAAAPFDHLALREEWLSMVGEGVRGYVTPKSTVGAVVGNDEHQILLVQRADSGIWLYPTGWADVGYAPAEVVEKEVHEETGIVCEVVRPIAILDGLRQGFTSIPLYSLVFHCNAVAGQLEAHPLECSDVGWFDRDDLPQPLGGSGTWVDLAFAAIDGEPIEVLFDEPRRPPWVPEA